MDEPMYIVKMRTPPRQRGFVFVQGRGDLTNRKASARRFTAEEAERERERLQTRFPKAIVMVDPAPLAAKEL